jgi:hypothetical protein
MNGELGNMVFIVVVFPYRIIVPLAAGGDHLPEKRPITLVSQHMLLPEWTSRARSTERARTLIVVSIRDVGEVESIIILRINTMHSG